MQREKVRRSKLYLPSLIIGNMRSLDNKMEELPVLVRKEGVHL